MPPDMASFLIQQCITSIIILTIGTIVIVKLLKWRIRKIREFIEEEERQKEEQRERLRNIEEYTRKIAEQTRTR